MQAYIQFNDKHRQQSTVHSIAIYFWWHTLAGLYFYILQWHITLHFKCMFTHTILLSLYTNLIGVGKMLYANSSLYCDNMEMMNHKRWGVDKTWAAFEASAPDRFNSNRPAWEAKSPCNEQTFVWQQFLCSILLLFMDWLGGVSGVVCFTKNTNWHHCVQNRISRVGVQGHRSHYPIKVFKAFWCV